jgi:hypothetical protein
MNERSTDSLREQMIWDGIEAVEKFGVDVGIVFVLFASGIVLDVEKLISEVVGVSYAMVVIPGVPDSSGDWTAKE